MGLLDKLLKRMPGGPLSVANNLLTHYNKIKKNPLNLSEKEIFSELLRSRYVIFKTMSLSQIDEVLETSDNLISITFDVLSAENPAAMQTPYFQDTFNDVCKFYRENSPIEYEKFKISISKRNYQGG